MNTGGRCLASYSDACAFHRSLQNNNLLFLRPLVIVAEREDSLAAVDTVKKGSPYAKPSSRNAVSDAGIGLIGAVRTTERAVEVLAGGNVALAALRVGRRGSGGRDLQLCRGLSDCRGRCVRVAPATFKPSRAAATACWKRRISLVPVAPATET